MEWTNEIPTKEGYYWLDDKEEQKIYIVNVRYDAYMDILIVRNTIADSFIDTGIQAYKENKHMFKWYGSLEIPVVDEIDVVDEEDEDDSLDFYIKKYYKILGNFTDSYLKNIGFLFEDSGELCRVYAFFIKLMKEGEANTLIKAAQTTNNTFLAHCINHIYEDYLESEDNKNFDFNNAVYIFIDNMSEHAEKISSIE